MKVRTDIYERVNGRKPRGRSYWRFQLVTERVTERDHFVNSKANQTYQSALNAATEIALRRRSHTVVVLP
jgi:hypothetical protein